MSSPSGASPNVSQTRSGRATGRPSVAEHNASVRDTGKAGKEPDSDICLHPSDLRYRGICVGCEAIAGDAPLASRKRKVKPETVEKYNAIISKMKVNPRKPHAFQLNTNAVEKTPAAKRCVCGKPAEARIHTDGPEDLAAHFQF